MAKLDESASVEKKNAPVEEEYEEIFVPRGSAGDEENYMIGVNGVNYLMPRGKSTRVPKHIAEEFRRSQRAQMKLDERIDEMRNTSSK